jgi:hypothetical protein
MIKQRPEYLLYLGNQENLAYALVRGRMLSVGPMFVKPGSHPSVKPLSDGVEAHDGPRPPGVES